MVNMNFLLLSLFAAAVTAGPYRLHVSNEDVVYLNDESGYRLPTTQVPSGYVISLILPEEIFNGTSTEFTGTASINFQVTAATNVLLIHAPNSISSSDMSLTRIGTTAEIAITGATFNATTEILTIILQQNLTSNIAYTLTMNYTGQLDTTEMQGIYRSTYFNENNGREYLVTTQFQPTYARKAFPCFDEPSFKATFELTITHPGTTTVLFNALNRTQTTTGSMTTTSFMPSPRMSSYLVAFVVSKFTCTEGTQIANNVPHYVCSTPQSENDRLLANSYSASIMQSLQSVTNIAYTVSGLNKVHQVAIPDFSAGAMENWGLVTYREMALLYNSSESSIVDKERVLTIIAHEFAHMWFGNLVTCDWWNNLFLNEGFASYFEYFTPASITSLEVGENWQLAKQFITDQQQNVFVADGFNTSNALTSNAVTPSQIWGKFSSISYLKGASVLRMMENFIQSANFINGIRNYLNARQWNTADPSHLWSALQTHVPSGLLPSSLTLADVMTNWIDTPGYPVVTAHARGNNVYLTQKRFLYEGSSSDLWYVPISYTLSNDTNEFSNVSPKLWLIPQQIPILKDVLSDNSWIILNNQESAYYRVNYDEALWNRIIEALLSNHSSIDVMNRAQIVDDALNLARAREITYKQTFGIIDYLKNEIEYFPWYSALNAFDYLLRVLGEKSSHGMAINNLQSQLLQSIRDNVSFTPNDTDHLEVMRTRLVLGRACRLGEPSCVADVTNLFREYRNGISVDRNLRNIVYCNGLRHSNNNTDWDFLWEQLHITNVASEQVTILSSLGCTKNIQKLEFYLEQSINGSSIIRRQDITRVWSTVAGSNPEGIEVALSFFFNNWQRISAYHSGTASLLSTVSARLTTQNQLQRLRDFATSANLTESLRSSALSAANAVEANIRWAYETREQLTDILSISGAISTQYVASTVAIVIMLMVTIMIN